MPLSKPDSDLSLLSSEGQLSLCVSELDSSSKKKFSATSKIEDCSEQLQEWISHLV